jgi:predicted ATP-dependent endonuclease of OLD family
MRITNIKITNFRSLKDVIIEDISDLTIFIGGNSSGKSNLLDALYLFFNEFDPAPERNIGIVSDYIWFDRNHENPISFEITVAISKDEAVKILSKELEFPTMNGMNELIIRREIKGNPQAASWITQDIRINKIWIIRDGKMILEQKQVIKPESTDPSQQPTIPLTQLINSIFTNISQLFKGQFKMVYATRNNIGTSARFGERTSFIQPTILSELTNIGGSLEKRQQDMWTTIERNIREISPSIQDIRTMGGQIAITETENLAKFPISLIGGGHQEILALIYQISKEEGIFGLEEPEIHLHPRLARQLYHNLQELSKEKQLFIATHSTVFIDIENLNNAWIIRKEGKETKVVRIEKENKLKDILFELGIQPSDIFFSNSIIFVEGLTEKTIFPILANKLGIDFKPHNLSIIPINGKSSGRYRLQVWLDAAKNTQIPYCLILDNIAEKEIKPFENMLKRNKNLFILKQKAIEDYYPINRLIEAMKSEYEIDLNEEEAKSKLSVPRDKSIGKLLKEKGKDTDGWKIKIGERIAKTITADEIDDEIRGIIERISTELRL